MPLTVEEVPQALSVRLGIEPKLEGKCAVFHGNGRRKAIVQLPQPNDAEVYFKLTGDGFIKTRHERKDAFGNWLVHIATELKQFLAGASKAELSERRFEPINGYRI